MPRSHFTDEAKKDQVRSVLESAVDLLLLSHSHQPPLGELTRPGEGLSKWRGGGMASPTIYVSRKAWHADQGR